MSSNITLALVRQASVFESLVNGPIQSERIVPGSCSNSIADGSDMLSVIRDRFGRDFGRDLAKEMDREFKHRAFLVDQAVELAVGTPAEMAAARQFTDILADAGDLERLAVYAGVVQVDVPDQNRVICRNGVELAARKIATLQQIVEIGADDPLLLRRNGRLLLEMRDKFFAGRIIGVADVVEQFEDQRSRDGVMVRVDQARQEGAADEIDDFGVARLEARQRTLVADRQHLAALDRDRRGDRRARQRADRPAAQNEVGAFVRCEGRRGADGRQHGGGADRAGHERAPGGHAHRVAEQAGDPAGIELIAKKELTETTAAHGSLPNPASQCAAVYKRRKYNTKKPERGLICIKRKRCGNP